MKLGGAVDAPSGEQIAFGRQGLQGYWNAGEIDTGPGVRRIVDARGISAYLDGIDLDDAVLGVGNREREIDRARDAEMLADVLALPFGVLVAPVDQVLAVCRRERPVRVAERGMVPALAQFDPIRRHLVVGLLDDGLESVGVEVRIDEVRKTIDEMMPERLVGQQALEQLEPEGPGVGAGSQTGDVIAGLQGRVEILDEHTPAAVAQPLILRLSDPPEDILRGIMIIAREDFQDQMVDEGFHAQHGLRLRV